MIDISTKSSEHHILSLKALHTLIMEEDIDLKLPDTVTDPQESIDVFEALSKIHPFVVNKLQALCDLIGSADFKKIADSADLTIEQKKFLTDAWVSAHRTSADVNEFILKTTSRPKDSNPEEDISDIINRLMICELKIDNVDKDDPRYIYTQKRRESLRLAIANLLPQ